jgi:hypothetical protein
LIAAGAFGALVEALKVTNKEHTRLGIITAMRALALTAEARAVLDATLSRALLATDSDAMRWNVASALDVLGVKR